MKVIGKDIDPAQLIAKVKARLGGASGAAAVEEEAPAAERTVDPSRFFVDALHRHSDARQGLPIETHREGVGRAVVLAKRAFRAGGKPFINELFERQRLFNGYARDAIALLFAEVRALRADVEEIKKRAGSPGT